MSAELTEIERARELILERAAPLQAEEVELGLAGGRALAEPVRAAEQVPGFDNSAMDGFAVRATDLEGASAQRPLSLRIVDESRAGRLAAAELGPGDAIAISTGAVLPAGADSVVRVEDTEASQDAVRIVVAPEPGANVRRAGDDIEPGTELLTAGARLGAAELGVLASIGCARPVCRRRPRLAMVSTGDELIGVSEPLVPGAVRNSNALVVPELARDCGAEIAGLRRAPDDRAETVAALAEALAGADVLVVCGGVSVGAHDHVKPALAKLGVEQVFWGVSLKPGKPTFFGTGERTLAFGLPGNPVSAYVTFLLFVRPALLALQGLDPPAARVEARLTEAYEKPADRAHAIRCRLQLDRDGWLATPAPHQGSHVMTSLLGADGLAMIPGATTRVEAGETVVVERLG